MSVVDEASRTQLHYLAEQARKAMAAETVVLIVAKPNHEKKRNEVGVGICAPMWPDEDQAASMAKVQHLIVGFADTLLREASGGKVRLMVQDSHGLYPATPDELVEKTMTEISKPSADG